MNYEFRETACTFILYKLFYEIRKMPFVYAAKQVELNLCDEPKQKKRSSKSALRIETKYIMVPNS